MSEIGGALIIPDEVFKSIEKYEKALENLEKKAVGHAQGISAAFKGLDFSAAFDGLKVSADAAADYVKKKFDSLNNTKINAIVGIIDQTGSAGGAGGAGTGVKAAQQELDKYRNLLMEVTNRQNEMVSVRFGDSNIAELRDAVNKFNQALNNMKNDLSAEDPESQQQLVELRNMLKERLKIMQMSEAEREAYDKRLHRKQVAEEKRQAKELADIEMQRKKADPLTTSANATTIGEREQAIKVLKEWRQTLSSASPELKEVNKEIKRHGDYIKEATGKTEELNRESSKLSEIFKRWMIGGATIFLVNNLKGFLRDIVQVRAEFELTQKSITAMLQDKFLANDIYQKTVALATKSPFTVKELSQYVRQLSAYRIETSELYETTKRLADVSAGLGVDMQRIILAYGQVKAAGYLRGTEVRQFTEAGIGIYKELQEYFAAQGEMFSEEQIAKMISNRGVSFEDVEAVFKRMTSEGGMFFQMQEKQAETLAGKLSNLRDSYDLMLNEIGREHEGLLKGGVGALTYLVKNWENFKYVIDGIIVSMIALRVQSIKTGQSMALVFSSSFMRKANPIAIGRVIKSLTSGLAAIGSLIGNIFKSMAANPIAVLITVLAGAVVRLSGIWYKYYTDTKAANAEFSGHSLTVDKLAESYRGLTNAMDKATASQKKSIEAAKRGKVAELVKMMKDVSYDPNIDIETLNGEELDKTFAELKTKYEEFILAIYEAKQNAASEAAKIMDDDIQENAKEFQNSGDEFLAMAKKMDDSLIILRQHAQLLKDKKSLNLLDKADRQDGEDLLGYYQRLRKVLLDIDMAERKQNNVEYVYYLEPKLTFAPVEELNRDAEKFVEDLEEIFGEIYKRGDMDVLQVAINNVALEKEWGALSKEFALRYFGINVAVNKENLEKEVDWVEDYLQKALSKNEYKFNVKITPVPDFITEGDEAKKARDAWQEVVERISRIEDEPIIWDSKLDATFKDTDLGRLKKIGETTVSKAELLSQAKAQLELAKARAKALGIEDAANKTGKSTRDIYTERISLLKEMNSKYEELKKLKSDAEAAGDIEKQYAASLKEVGMGNILAEGFVPTKEETAKMIETVAGQIKNAGKRSQAFREAASLRINIDKDELSNDLKSVKDTVTLYLNSINLFEELQKSGLGESDIKMMFGDIPVSFDEARKRIEEDYKATFGEIETWGENVLDAYNEHIDNIAKKEEEHAVSTAKALISAYKKQLTEQVQLDQWYFEEKAKIEANENLKKAPQLQQQLLDNLQEQYQKKTAENTWKEFQESSLYIDMFNGLGSASYKVLDMMEQKLASLRSSLSNLSPENLKTIAEQIEKIREEKNARNPFRALISGMKELSRLRKEYEKMGGDEGLVQASENADYFRQMRDSANRQYLEKKQEYDLEVKTNGLKSKKAKALETEVSLLKSAVNFNEKEYKAAQNTLDTFVQINGQISNIEGNLGKTIGDFVSAVDQISNAVVNLVSAISGGDDELQNMMNTVGSIGSTVAALVQKDYVGAITGALNSAAGIVTLMSDENDIVEMMEEQQRAIDRLERAYSRLYEQMEKAYDMAVLYSTKNFAADRLEEEIKGYEQLIRLERDRKNPDKDAIIGYENTISDLKDKLEDLRQTAIQALGGIGEDEYASVAQGFVDAWVDAFQEGEDAVDALNGKFDEMIESIIKKQMMLRAAKKYLEPVFKAIDAMFEDESDGGQNATRKELDSVKELMNTQGTELNAFLKDFADVLGFTNRASSDLSKLQQGISSVSEETATAIESLLNSIRFFVATQQNDVAIIKNAVTAYFNNSNAMDSPLLQEMKTQTSIQTDIRNALMDVIKGGHTKGGRGIRVFMD